MLTLAAGIDLHFILNGQHLDIHTEFAMCKENIELIHFEELHDLGFIQHNIPSNKILSRLLT